MPDRRKKTFIDFPAVRAGVLQNLQAKASSGASPGQTKLMLDFVMVDEGQDLDATAFGILSLTAKHLTVFADARQQIFEGGASLLEMQKHLNLTGQTASLLAAHRNSPDIAKLASYFGNASQAHFFVGEESAG